jgi:hypothetical protein
LSGESSSDQFNVYNTFYNEVGEPPDEMQKWSIDRIDYTKGYEQGNLRWATSQQQARNRGKQQNNTSGFHGVTWENKIHPNGINSTTYAVVQWKEFHNGKQKPCKKSFSAKKHGLLPAFAMACQYRKDKINELNTKGYGYADNHGQ